MIPNHSDGLDAHPPRTRRCPLPLRCGREHPEVAARADSISIGRAPGAVFCVDVLPRIRRKTARNFKCISLHAAYTKLMLEPAIAVGPLGSWASGSWASGSWASGSWAYARRGCRAHMDVLFAIGGDDVVHMPFMRDVVHDVGTRRTDSAFLQAARPCKVPMQSLPCRFGRRRLSWKAWRTQRCH